MLLISFSLGSILLDKSFRQECVIKFHLTFHKCFHMHPFWFVLIEKAKLKSQNSSSSLTKSKYCIFKKCIFVFNIQFSVY